MNTKKAFTLIELLVVIAIIAILAAILFPVFAQAREKARQTTCASNLKQLALGVIQYTQDYDECPPCGQTPPAWGVTPGVGWAGQIYSYIKSPGVYACPDDNANANLTTINGFATYLVSYAYNQNLANGSTNNGVVGNISKLSSAPMTVLFTEIDGNAPRNNNACGAKYPSTDMEDGEAQRIIQKGNFISGVMNGPYGANDGFGDYQPFLVTGPMGETGLGAGWACGLDPVYSLGRHSSGSNYTFWDGHVKWLVGTHVSPGSNAASSTSHPTVGSVAGGTGSTYADGNAYAATYSVI